MKLLILRLNGINSIQMSSPTEINFENSNFSHRGLFAITGPTGSGKSTLLDAISLALYGSTPRLSNISQSTAEEIVNKRAVKAIAEVEYEVEGDRYKSTWSVHRADHKLSGNFQLPKVSLAMKEGENWKILQSQKKQWLEENERRLGITEDNFQYAVVLAQGKFAKFLQANESHRAEILKELTQTDQFSQIGAKCYEVKEEFRKNLETLTSHLHLENANLLSEEQLREYDSHLRELNQDRSIQTQDQEQGRKWLEFENQWEQIQEEQSAFEQSFHSFEIKKSSFESKQEQLAQFRKIKDLIPVYREIQALIERESEIENEVENETKDYDLLTNQWDETEKEWFQFQSEWGIQQKIQNEHKHWIESMKGPQIRLNTLNELVLDSVEDFQTRQDEVNIWQRDGDQIHREIENSEHELAETRKWLNLYPRGNDLSQQMKPWLQELGRELNQCQLMLSKELKLSEVKKRISIAKDLYHQSQKELAPQLKDQGALEQKIELLDSEIDGQKTKLENRKADLESTLHDLNNQINFLKEKSRFEEELVEQADQLNQVDREYQQVIKEVSHLKQKLVTARQLRNSRQDLVETKKEILKLQAWKHHVREGEPCPLCGGMDHEDFQQAAPIDLIEFENQLEEAQRQFEFAVDQEKLMLDKQNNLEFQIKEIKVRVAFLKDETKRLPAELKFGDRYRKSLDDKAELESLYKVFVNDLKMVESKEIEQRQLRDELHQLQNSSMRMEKDLAQASETLKKQEWDQEALSNELEDLNSWLKTENKKWMARLSSPVFEGWKGINELKNYEDRKRFEEEGTHWMSDFENKERQFKDLQIRFNTAHLQQRQWKARGNDLSTKLTQAQAKRDKNTQDQESFLIQLNHLLGGKDPEEESQRIEQAQERLNSTKERLEIKRAELKQAKNHLQISLTKNRAELLDKSRLRKSKEIRFQQNLKSHKIDDLQDFNNQILEGEKLDLLEQSERELREEEIRFHEMKGSLALRSDKCIRGLKEKWVKFRQEDFDLQHRYAQGTLADIQNRLNETQEKLWEIERLQQENQEQKEKLGDLISEIKTAQSDFNRWSSLESLIGQKTGAAFNKVAQSLNLRRLIVLANEFLKLLKSRYQLVVDDQSDAFSLAMKVIDSEQDHQLRPLNNLSGGESFQMSLALALGLSEISSGGAEVKSLFIDEGFGTLDQTSLANVLLALQSLKASGKTVGIITHVSGIREFIPGGLELSLNSGGRGEIRVLDT